MGTLRFYFSFSMFLFAMLSGVVPPLQAEQGALAGYAQKLPAFSLQDPLGRTHSDAEFRGKGFVLLVTAPILRNEWTQRDWDELLRKTKPPISARWAFLEDMTPSSFKSRALSGIKKEYDQTRDPEVLIDPQGELRAKLGVSEKKNVVLVYDSNGTLIHAEEGKPTLERAEAIWKKLSR